MCIIFPASRIWIKKKETVSSGNPVNKENLSLFFHVMMGATEGAAFFLFVYNFLFFPHGGKGG